MLAVAFWNLFRNVVKGFPYPRQLAPDRTAVVEKLRSYLERKRSEFKIAAGVQV
jgi:hypothetical protein